MAARPTILFVGDLSGAGTRPVSELAAINPAFDDVQADMQIWNIPTQTFQAMQPGVNTNPNVNDDRWSLEARFRESIRPYKPTGTYYALKYALDSTLTHTSAKPSWSPFVTGSGYSALVTQMTNAGAVANGVGDVLRLDAIVISLYTDDFLLPFCPGTYGDNLRALIRSLRFQPFYVSNWQIGSLNDASSVPIILIEPQWKWSGLVQPNYIDLIDYRAEIHGVAASLDNVFVLRTHHLAAAPDNKTFNAASMVLLSEAIGPAMFAPNAPYDDGANPEAGLVAIFGDSIYEGTALNTSLPAHLTGVQNGINILQPRLGTSAALNAGGPGLVPGTNNLVSLDQGLPLHGVEPFLGDLIRSTLGEIWLAKGTVIGSKVYEWHPHNPTSHYQSLVKGYLTASVDNMRRSGRKPVAKLITICLGTNDILSGSPFYESVAQNIRSIIDGIKTIFTALNVDQTNLRFVIANPMTSTAAPGSPIVTKVREDISLLPESYPNISVVDLSEHASTDGVHLNDAGTITCAQAIFDSWESPQLLLQMQPLFMPSNTALRKALRLSTVPQSNDADAMINAALEVVRVGFYRALGDAKIAALEAVTYTVDPRTSAEYLRSIAATTEVKWMRSQLLRTMPTLFKDSGAQIQSWQEEGAFRDGSYLLTRDELRRLDEEIAKALEILKAGDMTLALPGVGMETVAPDSVLAPGDTVFKVL